MSRNKNNGVWLVIPWFVAWVVACGSGGLRNDGDTDSVSDSEAFTLSGTWEIVSVVDEKNELSFKFIMVEDEKGDLSLVFRTMHDVIDISGHVEGHEVSMVCVGNFGGENTPFEFEGTMSDDYVMTGSVSIKVGDKEMDGDYTMTKISPSTEIPYFHIPVASIKIDGDSPEWESIDPLAEDPIGDPTGKPLDGVDIKSLKLATNQDGSTLYFLLEVDEESNISKDVVYSINFSNYDLKTGEVGESVEIRVSTHKDSWYVDVSGGDAFDLGCDPTTASFIEGSVEIDDLVESKNSKNSLEAPFILRYVVTLDSDMKERPDKADYFGLVDFE